MSLPRRQSRLTAEQVIDEIYRDQDSDDEDFDSTNSSVSLRELDNRRKMTIPLMRKKMTFFNLVKV